MIHILLWGSLWILVGLYSITSFIIFQLTHPPPPHYPQGANRRHSLVNNVHRRLEETPATEDATPIQLTRNPTTTYSGSKRVTPPKRPSASPAAAAAKTEGITGDERKGNGNSKREEAMLLTDAPTEAPTTAVSLMIPCRLGWLVLKWNSLLPLYITFLNPSLYSFLFYSRYQRKCPLLILLPKCPPPITPPLVLPTTPPWDPANPAKSI